MTVRTWSLSAPAHESILLMRSTWNGWARMRMWKLSFPANLVMYLFADTRAASRASEVSCSFSSDTYITGGKTTTIKTIRGIKELETKIHSSGA